MKEKMYQEDKKALQDGVKLFREVYHKDISEKTFERKHFLNPNCLDIPYIIEYKNDCPVAMRWMMREKMLYDGMSLFAIQSSDDAVLPGARGLLFLKIRKKAIKVMENKQIDFEYGCFSKGDAMEIAEKFGEKCVVNLYLARLLLCEKTHRWKRFDIPYLTIVSNYLMKKRKKNLQKFFLDDLSIEICDKVTFTDNDYKLMNEDKYLHIERNNSYYQWKLQGKDNICVVMARKNGVLTGFLIIVNNDEYATVIDWDVFHKQKKNVLATMFVSICDKYQYIDIPSLNIESGEMNLFKDIGCKDMSKLWAPICICVKPIVNQNIDIILKADVWKHRMIDVDYYMNR